jgi:hypothetical protein
MKQHGTKQSNCYIPDIWFRFMTLLMWSGRHVFKSGHVYDGEWKGNVGLSQRDGHGKQEKKYGPYV